MLPVTTLLIACGVASVPAPRPVLPECELIAHRLDDMKPRRVEREWNRHYAASYEAIESGDLETARDEACTALALAAGFEDRDWRFAETLDELGLIHFRLGDNEASARAQARAVAEMLIAKGPEASEVGLYASRLAMPLAALGQDELATEIVAAPHRVFRTKWVTVDARLAERLEWLAGEYLRGEDLAASAEIQSLIDASEVEEETAPVR